MRLGMRRYIRNLLLGLVIVSVAGVADVYALTMGEAINKAGRQRMLTQRIVKSYLQIGQKVRLSFALDQRAESIELFESQLAELSKFAKTDEEKNTIKLITKLWAPVKQGAMTEPSKDQAEELEELAEVLLQQSHGFVLLLEKRSGTKAGHLVNIAGRQRMLTQRMAKFYLLRSWHMQRPEYLEGYEKAEDEFTKALAELTASRVNTKEIKDELAAVEKDWRVFGLSKLVGSDHFVPAIVVRSLDKILVKMNIVTGMYAKLKQ